MEEELSVANTNVRDEHLYQLSFYRCHVYVLLSQADLRIKKKSSLSKTKDMEIS